MKNHDPAAVISADYRPRRANGILGKVENSSYLFSEILLVIDRQLKIEASPISLLSSRMVCLCFGLSVVDDLH